jgi:serine/threonine protein kinase
MPDIDVTETTQINNRGPLAAGSIFAERYEIITMLGEGGMSTVYKARQINMDRVVALKVMHPWMLAEAKSYHRFQREAQAVSALNHPNIVKVLSFGIDESQPFLAMDFIEGQSFSSVLSEKKKLTADEALAIIIPCAKALSHAHSAGLIHRDIKPANIMLDRSNKVYLVDFGLAKALDGSDAAQKLTQTNGVIGTPFYMSPEQCERGELDARSDMYSLGCVLYEALSGKSPFSADSPFAVMYSHIHEEPPQLPASVPAWLAAVTMRMLEKDPSDRFANMDEVLAALEKTKAPDAVQRRKAKSKAVRFPFRTMALPLAVFALLACICGLFYSTFSLHSPTDMKSKIDVATLPTIDAALAEAHKYVNAYKQKNKPHSYATDPDGYTAKQCYARAVRLAKDTEFEPDLANVYWDSAVHWGPEEDGGVEAQQSIDKLLHYTGNNLTNPEIVRHTVDRFHEWEAKFHPADTRQNLDHQKSINSWVRGCLALDPASKVAALREELKNAKRRNDAVGQLQGVELLIGSKRLTHAELRSELIDIEPVIKTVKPKNWLEFTAANQALGAISNAWFNLDPEKGVAVISRAVQVNEEFYGKNTIAAKKAAIAAYSQIAILKNQRKDVAGVAEAVKGEVKVAEELVKQNPAEENISLAVQFYSQLSDLSHRLGRPVDEETTAKRGLELGAKLPPQHFPEYPQFALAVAGYEVGRHQLAQAEARLAKACARVEKYDIRTLHGTWCYGLRGELAAGQGRAEEGLRYCERSKQRMLMIIERDKNYGRKDLKQYDARIETLRKIVQAQNAH